MKPVGKKYMNLIEKFPLRVISDDETLAAADAVADALFVRADRLSQDESDYLDALNVFIRNYEREAHPSSLKKSSPREVLRSLLEEHFLTQAEMAKFLEVTPGRMSELLSGTRELSKKQISIVAVRFRIDATIFLPPPGKTWKVHAPASLTGKLTSKTRLRRSAKQN